MEYSNNYSSNNYSNNPYIQPIPPIPIKPKPTIPPLPPIKPKQLITKKMANLSIIIGSILYIGILFIIYKIFGIKKLSNTLFLLSIYILLLSVVFFTIGLYVEKKVIKDNINFIIKKMFDKGFYVRQKLILTPEQKETLNNDNHIIHKNNKKIIEKALISFGIFIFVMFISSIILWKYTKLSYNEFNKKIVFKNIIILFVIMIVQILFYLFVIGNNRPIGIYDLIKNIIHKFKSN